jgi:hypothetical protein
MDLPLYGRVLWRFRFLVGAGILAAIALSFISYAKIQFKNGRPVVSYRHPVVYQSAETLVITQTGFPWGRTQLPFTVNPQGVTSSNYADPGRLASLATFYAQLAQGDLVRARATTLAGVPAAIQANAILAPGNSSTPLPLINLVGFGTSPIQAIRVAIAGSEAFRGYIHQQQQASHTPTSQRIVVQVLNVAQQASVAVPRKKTLPVIVFLGVLVAAIAAAFVLENLRPRVRVVGRGAKPAEASRDIAHTA